MCDLWLFEVKHVSLHAVFIMRDESMRAIS